MNKFTDFITAAAAWVADHKKATLVIGCLLAGAVWGLWARGLFAAPLTCDLTGSTLTCPIPAAGTPPAGGGTTPPPVPVPTNDFSACPAGSVTTKTFYPQSNGSIGSVGAGKFISIRIVPTTANAGAGMFFSGVYGGAPTGVWAISEKACDVDSPIVDALGSEPATAKKPAKIAYMKGYLTPNIDGRYSIGPGKTMEIGKVYYLNIRVDTCQAAACSFSNVKLP